MHTKNARRLASASAVAIALLAGGCSKPNTETEEQALTTAESPAKEAVMEETNPFFQEWNTPFGAPPFGEIKVEHFLPAFEKSMAMHMEQIDAIATADSVPSFANTIEQMELAGAELSRVARVFFNLTGTESSEQMQALQRDISPMLTRHSNQIQMNEDLFKRIKAIYDNRSQASYDTEQLRLIERTYDGFVRSGANLTPEAREELAKINERISALTTQFGQNVLNDTRNFAMILDEKDLEGLPQSSIDAAAAQANTRELPGKYVITLARSSVEPFLQFSSRRDLREQAFNGWAKRGDNDNEFDNKAIVS